MCGIVGFTGEKNSTLLLRMLRATRHRGPDEEIQFLSPGLSAGMNRLSIIDLRKKLYPMRYKNLVLLYNGEVYNFANLKESLRARGIHFKTHSDAEVILPLFDLYGPKSFSMLEGMFAVFIYDTKKKTIYLARDKAGEKPLYFLKNGSFFCFASELKALLLALPNRLHLHLSSLCSYFYQGHTFAPQTIVEGAQKLPPAHYLKFNLLQNTIMLIPYWSAYTPLNQRHLNSLKEPALIKQLNDLIFNSVKNCLIADVPVGCFLSGGVDSSLITSFASKVKPNLQTFSITFPGFEKYDESGYARMTAKLCKTHHREVVCTAQNVREVIDSIGQFIDEPIIDAAVLPLYLLAKEARKHVKVILCGEGADEVFGGYERYQQESFFERVREVLRFVPLSLPLLNLLSPHRFRRLKTPIFSHYTSQRLWNLEMLRMLLPTKRVFLTKNPYPIKARQSWLFMQLTDLSGFLPEQLLMKLDKTTMYHSLEARAPYLNSKIIRFALQLPVGLKIRRLQGKYLLKKVAEQYLPSKIVWRKKHGFGVPLNTWFREDLKDIVLQSVADVGRFPTFFNQHYYRAIVDQHLAGQRDYTDQIWGMIVLTKFLQYHHIASS